MATKTFQETLMKQEIYCAVLSRQLIFYFNQYQVIAWNDPIFTTTHILTSFAMHDRVASRHSYSMFIPHTLWMDWSELSCDHILHYFFSLLYYAVQSFEIMCTTKLVVWYSQTLGQISNIVLYFVNINASQNLVTQLGMSAVTIFTVVI